MGKRLVETERGRVRDLFRQGWKQQAIADKFGCTRQTVANILAEPVAKAALAGLHPEAVEDTGAIDAAELADLPDYGAEGTPNTIEALAGMLTELREMARGARSLEDRGAYLSIVRQMVSAARELARQMPPPQPDPEQDPNMIAAANAFREKLREMLAQRRALKAELARWRAEEPKP